MLVLYLTINTLTLLHLFHPYRVWSDNWSHQIYFMCHVLCSDSLTWTWRRQLWCLHGTPHVTPAAYLLCLALCGPSNIYLLLFLTHTIVEVITLWELDVCLCRTCRCSSLLAHALGLFVWWKPGPVTMTACCREPVIHVFILCLESSVSSQT